ncbi:MAG: AAA family ATPase, partial [Halobacteriales archaeon]
MTDLGDFEEFDHDGEVTDERGEGTDREADPTGHEAEPTEDAFEEIDVDPVTPSQGIGVISAAEGLAISEEGDDTRLRAYVTVGNRSAVRIGSYLLVPYPDDETLFCRISALEYRQEFHSDDATEIHARRAMRSAGIDEQDYKFMATLDPVAVLYEDDDELKRRMTDRVPKPETVVREAARTDEIKTGLKIPADGVFLGHLSVGGEKVRTATEPPTIDYRLKDDYDAGDPLVF